MGFHPRKLYYSEVSGMQVATYMKSNIAQAHGIRFYSVVPESLYVST
jgi:hypothetical protein